MAQTMDDMKFIGFSGIFSQSFKTIFTWKKTFAQITLTLILPLAFTFISHMYISNQFFNQIEKNPYQLLTGAFDSYQSYYHTESTPADWRNYFLFKSITIAAVTVLSVLSTATVVYTIASVYTGRDVTYRKSMKVIPKVWKRLTVTFLCMLLTLFVYSLIASVLLFLCDVVLRFSVTYIFVWLAINILYIFGFMYLTTVWQVASVVSVLESSYGIKAVIKATDLMKGKRITALMISFMLSQFLVGVVYFFMALVVYNEADLVPVWQVMIGIICGILLVILFLVVMVTQTVLYLVCKSHHLEVIDPVSLSTFLSAYLSDSRPVFRTGEDIQLGRTQNQPVSQV
ncbi:hypothetical protein L1987_79765 [Smallanthus sonchifolius]|uniref:Uncharacterized protein n=1 Tax=Smallanthus sonchifolius TaxID=185202 RepID=A0ACB8YQ02_9ASTR|nr:hypothetical protein L1987_79765 [Smallanthus sonchifolius]